MFIVSRKWPFIRGPLASALDGRERDFMKKFSARILFRKQRLRTNERDLLRRGISSPPEASGGVIVCGIPQRYSLLILIRARAVIRSDVIRPPRVCRAQKADRDKSLAIRSLSQYLDPSRGR